MLGDASSHPPSLRPPQSRWWLRFTGLDAALKAAAESSTRSPWERWPICSDERNPQVGVPASWTSSALSLSSILGESPRTKIGHSLWPTLIDIVFISKKRQRLCFCETMRYTSTVLCRYACSPMNYLSPVKFRTPVKFGHRCILVTGEVWSLVKFTGDLCSLVKFGHQWSLVTGEVWSPVKLTGVLWSPVKFGNR